MGIRLAVTDIWRTDLRDPRLGQLLMMGRDLDDTSQVVAVMILIIGLGYLLDGLFFKTIEKVKAEVRISHYGISHCFFIRSHFQ